MQPHLPPELIIHIANLSTKTKMYRICTCRSLHKECICTDYILRIPSTYQSIKSTSIHFHNALQDLPNVLEVKCFYALQQQKLNASIFNTARRIAKNYDLNPTIIKYYITTARQIRIDYYKKQSTYISLKTALQIIGIHTTQSF